ncbi:MAG: efflux RND transporter periplasmic adaptor subunit [Victivallaceae bacterium]|nr:efflux RND transporter periplasmic adaptor subunit [Victivallaceae bacterium]
MKKDTLSLLLPALLLLLPMAGCRKEQPVAVAAPEVEVHTVAKGLISEKFVAVGQVVADDSVALVARVEGYLIKRNFREGAQVTKGTVLYEIEPEIYTAKVKSAEAELEHSKAAAENARIEYERQKTLIKKDATSERNFDDAAANKMKADADVKSAEAGLDLAKQNLAYTKIYAPFDGWVGISAYSVGNLVNQSSGTLTTVQKIDPMRVEFVLSEPDLLAVRKYRKAGQAAPEVKVSLRLQDGSNYDNSGKISYWSNQINTTTGTFKMQAVFANPKHVLIPGMFVRVVLEPPKPTEALLIPLISTMNDQAGDYVYAVDQDNRVVRRGVRLGYRDSEVAVVEANLKPGERIICDGLQKVRPGAVIKPVEKTAAAEPVQAKKD